MKSSRLFFLLILFIINCFILVWLIQDRSHVSGLTATTCNSDEFREQFLSPSLYKELSKTTYPGHSFAELLTSTMLDGDFFPKNVSANAAPYLKYKRDEFLLLEKYYEMIWSDLKYFPVANTQLQRRAPARRYRYFCLAQHFELLSNHQHHRWHHRTERLASSRRLPNWNPF